MVNSTEVKTTVFKELEEKENVEQIEKIWNEQKGIVSEEKGKETFVVLHLTRQKHSAGTVTPLPWESGALSWPKTLLHIKNLFSLFYFYFFFKKRKQPGSGGT